MSGGSMGNELEEANQKVTGLLQQVDDNINRATDNAAKLLSHVKEFVVHTKSVQSSLQLWINFFQSFEENERKKFFSDNSTQAGFKRRYGSPENTPSFGCSPPCSVRVKEADPDRLAATEADFSPVFQPQFEPEIAEHDRSLFKQEQPASPTPSVEKSYRSESSTPKISSPTVTVTLNEMEEINSRRTGLQVIDPNASLPSASKRTRRSTAREGGRV
ncbi:hypothetical protein GUITHDRAFT_134452 [Guillardia theta CCMP2712]|uniref:Uncharacterized protein n=1 Tax=Guillardia theta (strain CCMP2712) TaxID=905079 RepID=L1JSX0_GUITC|nr:hypothetical protein GUITHDRAFT_134452 [Guillardia theta CCMP2712]EKX51542.1 hypothetical protein GUITHDRAFT_134452 [Guillardia theta CCMP2712]|eukprot:XP_005838522.1 hypothetical protein GUITHDRAFT_134452 [Guillardia theta CCMP2712]